MMKKPIIFVLALLAGFAAANGTAENRGGQNTIAANAPVQAHSGILISAPPPPPPPPPRQI